MLRYKTKTRPGLVALYDIRPGNGAGPFLQPRSPHGAQSVDFDQRSATASATASTVVWCSGSTVSPCSQCIHL